MRRLADANVDQITAIATEVFAGMVDGESGHVTSCPGERVTLADPRYAWVNLDTEPPSRVQLTAASGTVVELTRALLGLDAGDPLTEDEVLDAFGEIANIFAGNIKAMLDEHVELAFPQVSSQAPPVDGAVQLQEVALEWRGSPFITSLWTL